MNMNVMVGSLDRNKFGCLLCSKKFKSERGSKIHVTVIHSKAQTIGKGIASKIVAGR